MRYTVILVPLAISVALGAQVLPPAEYPADPTQALAIYQQALATLKPVYLAPEVSELRPAAHVGRVIEVHAQFVGRISVNANDAERRRVLLRFTLPSGNSLYVLSPSELDGLPSGEPVRLILAVPNEDGDDPKFHLRGVVLETHITPEPQPAVQAPPAVVPPTRAAALPPELRGQTPLIPSLAPAAGVNPAAPRDGKDGAWDLADGTGIPVVEQHRLDVWTAWIRKHNPKLTVPQAEWIARWVIYYSAVYGVDHRLMFAMIKCESNFNPFAVSRAGAVGLTQLMPCNIQEFNVRNKWNVQEQIRAGIAHFREMLDLWQGRSNYEQFALAAASYNAGPNRVRSAGGIPNITETRNYVKKLGDLFYSLWEQNYP